MPIFLSFNQFRLLCERPSSGDLSEKTLEVHKNQTLGEATERAYKVDSALECLCYPTSLHWLLILRIVTYDVNLGMYGKQIDTIHNNYTFLPL